MSESNPADSSLSRRHFLCGSATAAATLVSQVLPGQETANRTASTGYARAGEVSARTAVTRTLANWLVGFKPQELPPAVKKEAVRSILNWIGVAVGGSKQDAVIVGLKTLSPYAGPPIASVFGRSEKVDPLNAALLNCMSSHVLDFDDTHLPTLIHPAGPVAAALFALSSDHPMSGAQFLEAFILGTEVECRLGNTISPSHFNLGWHITATCGAFGAAAACGKILNLTTDRMVAALGIAACEAAGLQVMFGSMCKSFQVGRAAENGLLAALLAAQGFTSAPEPLTGQHGYFGAASTHQHLSQLVGGLGEHFEISLNTYKPYACGIVIHPAIDGIIQLRKQYHLHADDIDSIAVRANPLVLSVTAKQDPNTGLEGKFSIYHSVAVALVRGHAGAAEYTDQAVRDPQIRTLSHRVQVTSDPSVHSDEVYLTIRTKDGRTLTKHVEHAIGSADHPMSDVDIEDKVKQLAAGILEEQQVNKLVALAWKLESLANISELTQAASLQPNTSPGS